MKCLIMRGFGRNPDGTLCSSYNANPFRRTYTLFKPENAPEDFPLYFFDNPIHLDMSSDWEVVGACLVDSKDIQRRSAPFLGGFYSSYSEARIVCHLGDYPERLTVTELTPVAILSEDSEVEGDYCFCALKKLSVFCGIPVWTGYQVF